MISSQKMITYELTRWDLFAGFMTVVFRKRILLVFLLIVLFFNRLLTLAPKFATHSLPYLLFDLLVYLVGFVGVFIVFQAIFGLANAFIPKHNGVLGRHVLEITEEGLVERTDFNETLHRWSSIFRIFSLWGYIYIYVSESNSHQIPKRCFPPLVIEDFVSDLRRRVKQTNS
ncbi:YcxB family protein [Pseudanabaena sp. UWO311]|uniref:YcxB family protein n=1 Tax=Pseudanabaena sp. UWO311 TaxID=2487337 RepID=UPI001157B9B3|nr:YcxB family protein [Pseudanabaena sp. UWO311]